MAGNAPQCPVKLGPYELVRHIATGGMAEVYLARRDGPHGFSKTVALKRILPQLARDADFVAMFVDEARVCAQLSHPNLVQVFDFGEAGSELYMAMEYVDGTTCAKVVRRAASSMQLVPIEAALHIVLSVLRGLEYAHAAVDLDGVPLGLVHRDVSPGNILIARSGAVKLGDFGIARADEFERRTEEGQLKGKLGYMSPEQVTGRPLDARSDLFTLGIVTAEILTARPLFTGSELDVLMRIRDADLAVFDRNCAHVPEPLRLIVRKSLAQEPDDRFLSATSFAEAIEDFARNARLSVAAPRLVAWLASVGLLEKPRSGEHSLDLRAAAQAPAGPQRRRSPLSMPAVTLSAPIETVEAAARQKVPDTDPNAISPAIYRVAREDKVFGPISFPKLVELFATGKANLDTLIARETGPFRPARDLPELARLPVSPAFSPFAGQPGQQHDSWAIDRASLAGRLFDLVLRRETGLLVALQNQRRKQFFLVDGNPAFTTSTDKNELLGQQLIARGMVVPMEIDMALALCPRYGGRLGDALVGLGVLRPIELFRALVAQTQERLIDLLCWRQGHLDWIPGVRADAETILHGTSPLELIAEGVLQGYPELELQEMFHPLRDQRVRPVSSLERIVHDLRLTGPEAVALRLVDASLPIDAFVERCAAAAITRGDALRGLFLGLSARALVADGWPPAVQHPSVPTMRM
jgi:serine/threonine-protein kinase